LNRRCFVRGRYAFAQIISGAFYGFRHWNRADLFQNFELCGRPLARCSQFSPKPSICLLCGRNLSLCAVLAITYNLYQEQTLPYCKVIVNLICVINSKPVGLTFKRCLSSSFSGYLALLCRRTSKPNSKPFSYQ
jgi:hypothetical protein